MGRIKTRESVKDIKILDKVAVVSERMKTALVRSKDQAENLMDDGQISPSEYAEDKIRYAAEDVTDQVWHEVSGQTKKAIEKGKEAHREHRNEKRIHKNEERVRRYEEELRRGAPSRTPREDAARQAARQNTEATRTSIRSRRNQTIKSAERTERTIKQSARSAGKQTVKAGAKGTEYYALEMSGSRAVWPEVLSVYAVKTTSDPDNPQEVATITPEKEQLLKDLFWEMNEITHRTETKTETVIVETDDGNGNILEEETQETITTLYIAVSHKTADEMAAQYGFNENQKQQLAELLAQDSSMWAAVLYGIYGVDDQIVAVALSQVGNVGGEPYWSWYGFGSRVEWCACFVSWCANECGYIDTGVIPKFAGCVNGVQWFRERGQWADNSMEPSPGMIIFFDWDNKGSSGPQDGQSDHVGIVQKVENGVVYTIEGNSGDSCRVNQYPLGYYEILGYGVVAY